MTRALGVGRWRVGRRWLVAIGLLVLSVALLPDLRAKSPTPNAQSPTPARIISLVPSVTEMLFALGAGDAVIGVSSFDHYPSEVETRTKVGGLLDPDFERILSLRPDLVVVYGTQGDLIDRLTRARVPLFHYEHAGLADVTQTIRALGVRVGRSERANQLAADIEARLNRLRSQTASRPKPATLLVFEREPGALRGMYTTGSVGFLHDMLEVAGGANVFADVKRPTLQITAELVLARAPAVILEIHSGPDWTAARVAREREVWRPLASIPAVRNNRVYILTDEMISIPGPRVADAAAAIAKVLHPELQ
jgi:ABC-type Fe3+-hydroxamate transport system substrate-binding protein